MSDITIGNCHLMLGDLSKIIGVRFPFSFYMATVAKAYQVGRFVSLFVIGKIRKPNNVVNIQLLPIRFFGYVASLAGVPISLSNISSLTIPIWPIVSFVIAALPACVIFARIAYAGAFERAESKPSSTFLFCGEVYSFPTLFAGKIYARLGWWMRDNDTFFSRFLVAGLRAKRGFGSVLLKRLFGKFGLTISANVLLVYLLVLPSLGVRAFLTASGLPSPLESLWVS